MSSAVSVIIPVFNNWELTRQCLVGLAENSPPGLEVVVVDNGSSDETAENLESFGQGLFSGHFPAYPVRGKPEFCPGMQCRSQIGPDGFSFFLNNDTLILPGWLPPLLAEFSLSSRLGAAGPLLMYPDKTVQHLGIAFWPEGIAGHIYQSLPVSHKLASRKRFFRALTGAALLVPRSLFLREGGFDEGYVNGFEDVDFGLRLARHGYRLCNAPESRIMHLESRTPHRYTYHSANSRRLACRMESVCMRGSSRYCCRRWIFPARHAGTSTESRAAVGDVRRVSPTSASIRCGDLLFFSGRGTSVA